MQDKIEPIELKCEYSIEPLAIDVRYPRLSWQVKNNKRNNFQTAYHIMVADNIKSLDENNPNIWNSGKIKWKNIGYAKYKGKRLESDKSYFWKVKIWDSKNEESEFSKVSKFDIGLFNSTDWKGEWLTTPQPFDSKVPVFRKELKINKTIKRARAYISGLGYYELSINGDKIGDNVLDPAWSDYSKRVYYSSYDLNNYLKTGKNVIGVMLGNGWFVSPIGRDSTPERGEFFGWGSMPGHQPQFILQINILYSDNQREEIISKNNDGWMVSFGPITMNGIYTGEVYDARLEKSYWDTPDYDIKKDKNWFFPVIAESPGGQMVSQNIEPIKILKEIKPISLSEPEKGIYVVDLGQNISGWAKIKVQGNEGTTISLKFSEILYENGKINQENLRTARATDIYILKGKGVEEYEPRFTYHGFRYIQIEGWPGKLKLDNITGKVVASSVKKTGEFECSNDLINKIQQNTLWSLETNRHSVPTDCPQRDERMGWINDVTTRAEAEIYNYDMSRFYSKWIYDVIDAQGKETGAIPETAPYVWGAKSAEPIFNSFIIIPWLMYIHYGDDMILKNSYEPIKKWLDWLEIQADNFIIEYGVIGDWIPPAEYGIEGSAGSGAASTNTPPALMSTGYFYYSIILFLKIARALNEIADCEYYSKLANNIKNAFNNKFFNPESSNYSTGNQACNILPLFLGIIPESHRKKVLDNIVSDIEKHDYHLTTGNQCTKYLIETLTDFGYGDIAYKIVTQESYPGWGYMIKKGATTIWERWEYLTGSGMNSHNHPVFGMVSSWFYKFLAGIEIININDEENNFNIKPVVFGNLKFAMASIETINGMISSSWKREKDRFLLEVDVPFNCSANIYIPILTNSKTKCLIKESTKEIFKNGKYNGSICGINNCIVKSKYVVFSVGSGKYYFCMSEA